MTFGSLLRVADEARGLKVAPVRSTMTESDGLIAEISAGFLSSRSSRINITLVPFRSAKAQRD